MELTVTVQWFSRWLAPGPCFGCDAPPRVCRGPGNVRHMALDPTETSAKEMPTIVSQSPLAALRRWTPSLQRDHVFAVWTSQEQAHPSRTAGTARHCTAQATTTRNLPTMSGSSLPAHARHSGTGIPGPALFFFSRSPRPPSPFVPSAPR